MAGPAPSAAETAESHRVEGTCLYLLGSFDRNVTVLGQQNRALNLAWALIDDHLLSDNEVETKKVAVVGGGFAGLTFVSALLQKEISAEITIFEERDTLLPLQQGSDTRWLHPNIYDWPAPGSDASVAMLPVLNWAAGRASDVVVHVLSEWRSLLQSKDSSGRERAVPRLFCNTRHLQIAPSSNGVSARIEWVGEQRSVLDGSTERDISGQGSSEDFDLVVLAIGFGPEKEKQLSYWRNETYGQPSLSEQRRTFLVSGQGDGAMIDLLRVRVSQYRQDRILNDLFSRKRELIHALKMIRESRDLPGNKSLFRAFEELVNGTGEAADQMRAAQALLSHRLRRDTDAILHLEVRNLEELFSAETSRTSFQNALLVYLLYRCGGFAPSSEKERSLRERYGILPEHIIRRHGTDRAKQLERILPQQLFRTLIPAIQDIRGVSLRQAAEKKWPGGYFGFKGPTSRMRSLGQSARRTWRKEHLPAPSKLLAASLCSAVSAFIRHIRPNVSHFRLTLHRTLPLHGDNLLQQACDYKGVGLKGASGTAARTYPVTNGTIGLCFRVRQIVRSRRGVSPEDLTEAMQFLDLEATARKMATGVRFLLTIPLLQPEGHFFGPSPVAAILYLDSKDESFWLEDEDVRSLVALLSEAATAIWQQPGSWGAGLRNVPLAELLSDAPAAEGLPGEVAKQLELVADQPPRGTTPHSFNFEFGDLTPRADLNPEGNQG